MNQPEEIQPAPGGRTPGLFAQASADLFRDPDDAVLDRYVRRLADLADLDLVLVYEARPGVTGLVLIAAHGLPSNLPPGFRAIDEGEVAGEAEPRAPSPAARAPNACNPLGEELRDLGIRACSAFPLRSGSGPAGRLFFGSRRWDVLHPDTVSILAAASAQVALILERRASSRSAREEPVRFDAFKESADQSRQALPEKDRFIAVLAHELRNPMAPIRSGLDLLLSGRLNEDGRRETALMMQRQLARLVRLTDDLLDTVRLSTGRLQARREPVQLRAVLQAAVESVQPAVDSKRQVLKLVDAPADVVIDADPVRLSQAFANILSVNVKETPPGGEISVRVEVGDETLAVSFEDQGSGIDPDEIGQLFELFPKSAADLSDGNLGVGLALVKGLIELNDGTVEARSRDEGHGAIYTVRLPVLSLAEPPTRSREEAVSAGWHSRRLLIVDDNRDAAETLALLFELDGQTVRMAHDGPCAVAEAAQFQPEVVLMDLGLPGFSGIDAIKAIRAAEKSAVRPVIIALTGWGSKADRDATREAGADLHMVKPIAHEALREAIESLIRPEAVDEASSSHPAPARHRM